MKKSHSAPCLVSLGCTSVDSPKTLVGSVIPDVLCSDGANNTTQDIEGTEVVSKTIRTSMEVQVNLPSDLHGVGIHDAQKVDAFDDKLTKQNKGAALSKIQTLSKSEVLSKYLSCFNTSFRLYFMYSRMKRDEERYGQRYIMCICILDIAFQDSHFTNWLLDTVDYALTSKDLVESLALAGFNIKNLSKKKELAILKIMFVVYKLIIYKWFISSLVDDNSFLHMFIDYINMVLDHIIS
jgi:hypothetical protein